MSTAFTVYQLAMHAPDGMFSLPINLIFGLVVLAAVAWAWRRLQLKQQPQLASMMGIMAAFIFAAQMVNFPISSGTTGHLLGGTMGAILLGPWAGTIVMVMVVMFQALLGDGGLTVLGPNIFNMGLIGTCFAYFVYRLIVGQSASTGRLLTAAFFASWLAVVLASIFASLQLAVSGTASLDKALPAMVGVHLFIGVGEALITTAVIAFILRTRPELLYRPTGNPLYSTRPFVALGLGGALAVSFFLSLLPTLWDYPDGLEYVGMQSGFIQEEAEYDDAKLSAWPCYPLGVRLVSEADDVIVAHRYDNYSTPLVEGDRLLQINGIVIQTLQQIADLNLSSNQNIVSWQRGSTTMDAKLGGLLPPTAGGQGPLLALLPDYSVPGVQGWLSTSLAGVIGTVVMFIVSLFVGRLMARPSAVQLALAQLNYDANTDSLPPH
ncbi:MAG: Cobalt transport protein CbiM [Phycisphaerae bacterium]|nr:Cobalt transport protein CbiM [Phycisphaerae bacterium]